MNDRVYNVLFLCTGNSARSIMAEVAASSDAFGLGRLQGYSAGSQPTGRVHPQALNTLQAKGLSTQGVRSKSWEEFQADSAPRIDLLITVCDSAANEVCPIWPGRPVTAHWGVADPAAVAPEQQPEAFDRAFEILSRRIRALVEDLPSAWNPDQLQLRAKDIGAQS